MNILLNIILSCTVCISPTSKSPLGTGAYRFPQPFSSQTCHKIQATAFELSLAEAINRTLNASATASMSLPLTVDPSLLSSSGPPPSSQVSMTDQNMSQTPSGGWEGDLSGEDFPSPNVNNNSMDHNDVNMGDATVGNAQEGGLVGGDMTFGNAKEGGLVGGGCDSWERTRRWLSWGGRDFWERTRVWLSEGCWGGQDCWECTRGGCWRGRDCRERTRGWLSGGYWGHAC